MPPAVWLLQEAAAPPGGEGGFTPFSINTGLVFWTILVFLILLALLWRFAWPTILRSVEERERRIQAQLDEAERARVEAARLLEERERGLAEKERATLLAKAREEYEQLLARARTEIEAEKEKAVLALRREAVELSIAAASRLIEARLDTEANRRLVMEYLATLEYRQ